MEINSLLTMSLLVLGAVRPLSFPLSLTRSPLRSAAIDYVIDEPRDTLDQPLPRSSEAISVYTE